MSAKTDAKIMFLSANTRTTSNMGIVLLSNTNDHGVGYDSSPDKPTTNAPPSPKIVYYELERDAVFTVSNVFFFQIDFSVKITAGSHILTEKANVLFGKTEISVLLQKGTGGFIVFIRGHNQQGEKAPRFAADG